MSPEPLLGTVNDATLALEKQIVSTSRHASWNDANGNDEIDAGETVYWAWNSGGHSNSLIPIYARGVGATQVARLATFYDPVRGAYLDNTDVFRTIDAVLRYPIYLPLIVR